MNNRGSLGLKLGIGGGALVVLAVLMIFIMNISYQNTYERIDQDILAQYKKIESNYEKMSRVILQQAGILNKYSNDFKEIYKGMMQGRYGKDGSKAMFQFIKEHNPKLDSSIYKQLQRTIEAGRKEFAAGQTGLLDRKRAYKDHLRSVTGLVWAGLMGYPTIDLSKFDIVTSERTQNTFKSGKDNNPIKFR